MIITLILIGVALVCGLVAWLATEKYWEVAQFLSVIICICACGAVIVSGIVIAGEQVAHDANLSRLQAEREALVYQFENNMYLGDAVGKFNGDLAAAQVKHNSPWTNWFYGDYYMEVDPIELK